MAARGMTNKQIAQALFVTLRTVEMHFSNAYGKLEIRSRRQLPEAFASPMRRVEGACRPAHSRSSLKISAT
jgi:DNA-binding NarL/FixJ family response regulator